MSLFPRQAPAFTELRIELHKHNINPMELLSVCMQLMHVHLYGLRGKSCQNLMSMGDSGRCSCLNRSVMQWRVSERGTQNLLSLEPGSFQPEHLGELGLILECFRYLFCIYCGSQVQFKSWVVLLPLRKQQLNRDNYLKLHSLQEGEPELGPRSLWIQSCFLGLSCRLMSVMRGFLRP